ncbi:MAG: hypothetical protein IKE70_00195 [Bacilli bacterium]|nr:hypothetical protein [Bacilli bacterium]
MSKNREFSEEEIQFILNNWGNLSMHEMRIQIRCSQKALLKVAEEYQLELPLNRFWTDEEIKLLKNMAPYYTIEDISLKIGKSKNAIFLKASKLGITLYWSKREWNEEEEDELRRLWGTMSIEKLAKKLKRSVSSVKVRANRLHLGPMYGNDARFLTIPMISNMLGVSYERITTTWISLGLKVERRSLTSKMKYNCVSWEELISFLENHQDEWDSRNLEKYALVEEFDWLIKKRKRDLEEDPLWYRRWNNTEIEELKWMLLVEKKNYAEIAASLRRTESSVARMARELGLQYRLPQYWKGEELLYLKNNSQNLTYGEMANHLGRSERAVKNKVYTMKYLKKK